MRLLKESGGKQGTVLSISKSHDNWIGCIFFKSCQISGAFPPFIFWTKNQFSTDLLCFQGSFEKAALFSPESLEAFISIYQLDVRRKRVWSSFYKRGWLLQVDNRLDSWLSSQLTTPVPSLIDDFPFLSWWSEAYKYLFCCCGNTEVWCSLLAGWFHLWGRKNGPFTVNGCRSKQTGDYEFIWWESE